MSNCNALLKVAKTKLWSGELWVGLYCLKLNILFKCYQQLISITCGFADIRLKTKKKPGNQILLKKLQYQSIISQKLLDMELWVDLNCLFNNILSKRLITTNVKIL